MPCVSLKLANTLLDFSRIEAGRVDASFEPTDLSALTTELTSMFASAVERGGLSLHMEVPPLEEHAWVDRDMWEKVVFNLLSNALKFTFDGRIDVSLRSADHHVEFVVRDTGFGIAAALPHVFDRFHRIKGARARSHEGTGIGLALVAELAKLHGGRDRRRHPAGGRRREGRWKRCASRPVSGAETAAPNVAGETAPPPLPFFASSPM